MGTVALFNCFSDSGCHAGLLGEYQRKEERSDRRAEAVNQMTDAMVTEDMNKNPSEYLFGGYFDEGNFTTEELEVLNGALRTGQPDQALKAFALLRQKVLAELVDTNHRNAERIVDKIGEY